MHQIAYQGLLKKPERMDKGLVRRIPSNACFHEKGGGVIFKKWKILQAKRTFAGFRTEIRRTADFLKFEENPLLLRFN